jgi:hypothetical protein
MVIRVLCCDERDPHGLHKSEKLYIARIGDYPITEGQIWVREDIGVLDVHEVSGYGANGGDFHGCTQERSSHVPQQSGRLKQDILLQYLPQHHPMAVDQSDRSRPPNYAGRKSTPTVSGKPA